MARNETKWLRWAAAETITVRYGILVEIVAAAIVQGNIDGGGSLQESWNELTLDRKGHFMNEADRWLRKEFPAYVPK